MSGRGRIGVLTLAQMLEASQFAILVAEPGVGKSTAVARVLQDQGSWWRDARRSSKPDRAPYGPSMPIALPSESQPA
ncbi:hypothetical protein [Actinomadura sp. 6N118]|uniref:hypothetical protein n=1 Tax=Actinomadura sp. 6N118 TaxID=3375151 RepID=UPI0037B00546